jgi:thioredoxin 2
MAGRLKLVKVNVDESPKLSRRFDAQSIPTLVLLRDGKVIAKQVGALPAARLRSWLTNHLP